MSAQGIRMDLRAANVWLHPNLPKSHGLADGAEPYCVRLFPGIGVSPPGVTRPRLPLLGLRALFLAKLRPAIDWRQKGDVVGYFSLRTSRRFFRFFG